MRARIFVKISSFALAFVVFFSTMSFTIDKHYCGEILIDVAINTKANTCGMGMMQSSKEAPTIKKSCCQNEHLVILGQDELKKQLEISVDFNALNVLEKIAHFELTFIKIDISRGSYSNHDPPDLDIDFQVLYETYLI